MSTAETQAPALRLRRSQRPWCLCPPLGQGPPEKAWGSGLSSRTGTWQGPSSLVVGGKPALWVPLWAVRAWASPSPTLKRTGGPSGVASCPCQRAALMCAPLKTDPPG